MRKFVALLVLALAFSFVPGVVAQEAQPLGKVTVKQEKCDCSPGTTLFAGYSIATRGTETVSQGFTGSVSLKAIGNVGVKFDFTNLNRPVNAKTYLIGPEVHWGNKARLFGHALFGAAYSNATVGQVASVGPVKIEDTSFAAAFGGGLDIVPTKHAGIRLFQVDYLRAPIVSTGSQNHFRLAAGVVIRF